MTTWNYRIIATEDAEYGEAIYALHEVYYDDNGKLSWTKSPVTLQADSKLGMFDVLAQAMSAANSPVLWWEGDELVERHKGDAVMEAGR